MARAFCSSGTGEVGLRGEVCDPASLEDEHRVREKQEGASALPARCGEGALDVLRPSRLQDLQLQPQCARGTSRLVHKGGLAEPVRRVPEHGDAAEPRNDLLEQLELLLGHLRGEEGEACDVPTRVSEAGYETTPLGECGYDDRYGLRSLSRGAGVDVVRRYDDVGFPSDELRGKGRDPLGSPLRGEMLDDEVLALHVTDYVNDHRPVMGSAPHLAPEPARARLGMMSRQRGPRRGDRRRRAVMFGNSLPGRERIDPVSAGLLRLREDVTQCRGKGGVIQRAIPRLSTRRLRLATPLQMSR